MSLLINDRLNDQTLAEHLARDAGALLAQLRSTSALSDRALGDAADRAANDYLLQQLSRTRPNDAVLSEESIDDLKRLTARRVWIIDPLDGTREFREGGDDWAVHVALVEQGQVVAAVVSIPIRGEVFGMNDAVRARGGADAKRNVVISRTRPPAFATHVAAALDAELHQVGSAGAKAMMVVRGDALAYVHEGGMNEWDAAAPVGVALAHGLHVSDLHGSALSFNQRDVVLREGLLICEPAVADAALAALNAR